MKKITLFLFGLFLSTNAFATALTMPYCNKNPGDAVKSNEWNGNCSAVPNFLNNQNLDGNTNIAVGGILTQNIANNAVTDSKISGITTAGKVNGSSITGLNNIPTGAGQLPQINLAELTSAGNLVDGSALTGLTNVSAGAGVLPVANGGTGGSSGVSGVLGNWQTKSAGTIYQALTDGFVTSFSQDCGASQELSGITDNNASPSTVRIASASSSGIDLILNVSFPVRKNDYWKIIDGCTDAGHANTTFFISLGS